MKYTYDKYYSVDLAIDLYLELIEWTKNTRPEINTNLSIAIPNLPLVYTRIFASTYSAYIAKVNEIILDLSSQEIQDEVDKKTEKVMQENDVFSKIKPKVPMSKSELKQQLKNALAHSEYTVGHDENSKICLDISSPKIEGKISIDDLFNIMHVYRDILGTLSLKRKLYQAFDLFTQRTNNKQVLRKSIGNIKVGDYLEEDKDDIIHNRKNIECSSSLTEAQQQFIYDYIMYVGIQNWIKLSMDERMFVFASAIKPQIDNNTPPYVTSRDLEDLLDFLINKGSDEVDASYYKKLVYKFPIMYTNFILELGYLCLNHIKESNAKETLENFNYRNISLKGIRYEPKSCVRLVTKENQDDKYNKQLEQLKQSAAKEREKLEHKHQEILALQNNDRISPDKKKELLERRKQEIETISSRLSLLTSRIYEYEDLIETSTDYIETNDFFKHLRNSISHGFYRVDLTPGLQAKDLGKTVFYFEDWDISKEDRKTKTKIFAAELTGDQLINIFKELQERLISSSNTFDQQINKDVYIIGPTTNNKCHQKVKSICEKYKQRGANVIKTSTKES